MSIKIKNGSLLEMQLNSREIKLLMSLEENYEQIMQPDKLVKSFKTMAEFKNWCQGGEVIDLEEAIKVFEAYELYEYCAIMKEVITEKCK